MGRDEGDRARPAPGSGRRVHEGRPLGHLGRRSIASTTRAVISARSQVAQRPLSNTCRFRILDSRVSMVQPAKDWMRNNVSEPLDLARVRRVLS
jgi:hypothetical protein